MGEIIALMCPNCGATLNNIWQRGGSMHCEYCGSSLREKYNYDDPTHAGSAFFRRALMELQDRNFKEAEQFFERVLEYAPEFADAWWGIMLAKSRNRDLDDLLGNNSVLFFTRLYNHSGNYICPADISEILKTIKNHFGLPLTRALKFWDQEKSIFYDKEIFRLGYRVYDEYLKGRVEYKLREILDPAGTFELVPTREKIKDLLLNTFGKELEESFQKMGALLHIRPYEVAIEKFTETLLSDYQLAYNDYHYDKGRFEMVYSRWLAASEHFKLIPHYLDSASLYSKCILQNIILIYNTGKDEMQKSEWLAAANCFSQILDYEDSNRLHQTCLELFREKNYDTYVKKLETEQLADDEILELANIFESFGDYKSSKSYFNRCRAILKNRKDMHKKIKKARTISILYAIAHIAFVACLFIFPKFTEFITASSASIHFKLPANLFGIYLFAMLLYLLGAVPLGLLAPFTSVHYNKWSTLILKCYHHVPAVAFATAMAVTSAQDGYGGFFFILFCIAIAEVVTLPGTFIAWLIGRNTTGKIRLRRWGK